MVKAQELGIIARTYEDDMPVIYKLVDELPDETTLESFPWLTLVSWDYDASENNGMPDDSAMDAMNCLERAIQDALVKNGLCRHAYSRTGNGQKNLVYYASNRDAFMAAFNDALIDHPKYPLEIGFYNDGDWDTFRKLLAAVRKNG